jgi:hypothetical protein
MSAAVAFRVQCDEPACDALHPVAMRYIDDARAFAAADGWKRAAWHVPRGAMERVLDLCPAHAHLADAPAPPFPRKARRSR